MRSVNADAWSILLHASRGARCSWFEYKPRSDRRWHRDDLVHDLREGIARTFLEQLTDRAELADAMKLRTLRHVPTEQVLQSRTYMLGTILHVEDDPALAESVKHEFQGLGFQGTTVPADSVARAEQILDDRAKSGDVFDLIISNMDLPDGSGLDVVRHARSSPLWERTPILILSGDRDPNKVGCAYALGINAYVDTAPEGRTLHEVVRAMYEHWAKDVVLASARTPTIRAILRGARIRARYAEIYQRLATIFADSPSESAFWLSRAVVESNFTNLMDFIRRQSAGRELPSDILDEMSVMQDRIEAQLASVEAALAAPAISRIEAYSQLLEVLAKLRVEVLARTISYLFPIMPAAMIMLRQLLTSIVDEVTTWIDLHSVDPSIRAGTARLRATTDSLLASPPPELRR